jgi:hypothetical protein
LISVMLLHAVSDSKPVSAIEPARILMSFKRDNTMLQPD